ncbi:MAG: hypothetical protein JWN07_788 [Hyphomicrobiales bacterium]|nr:hypothetical protein [Hyphomicrobiales bacterium]
MVMSRAFAGLVLLGLAATPALAQQNKNIRGTIEAFDGSTLKVETYEGAKVSVSMPADVRVSTSKPFSLSDVKPGMKLGVTTVTRPADGAQIALEVHPISATARDGLSPHDLKPGSTMNNGYVEATVGSTGGTELTLDYKSGKVKVLIVPETAMAQAAPGALTDLKAGEAVFVAATQEGEKLVATRAQVSKDGVKPPM